MFLFLNDDMHRISYQLQWNTDDFLLLFYLYFTDNFNDYTDDTLNIDSWIVQIF